MSWDPGLKRQYAVDIACFLGVRAMLNEQLASIKRGKIASDPRMALAAALEAIERERTARRPDSAPFTLQDCIAHLRASAAPRRARGRAAGAEGLR